MKRSCRLALLGLALASLLMQSQMNTNDHAIGSLGEKWEKFQIGGREAYVRMDGFYYSKPSYPGFGFHTYVVANLPESTIVGAPESVMNDVEGNCDTRRYHVLGTIFFAGKNRSGEAMKSLPPEEVERKLVVDTPFKRAFDKLCPLAMQQK